MSHEEQVSLEEQLSLKEELSLEKQVRKNVDKTQTDTITQRERLEETQRDTERDKDRLEETERDRKRDRLRTYLEHQTCCSSNIIGFKRNKCTELCFLTETNISCHGIGALITLHIQIHTRAYLGFKCNSGLILTPKMLCTGCSFSHQCELL